MMAFRLKPKRLKLTRSPKATMPRGIQVQTEPVTAVVDEADKPQISHSESDVSDDSDTDYSTDTSFDVEDDDTLSSDKLSDNGGKYKL